MADTGLNSICGQVRCSSIRIHWIMLIALAVFFRIWLSSVEAATLIPAASPFLVQIPPPPKIPPPEVRRQDIDRLQNLINQFRAEVNSAQQSAARAEELARSAWDGVTLTLFGIVVGIVLAIGLELGFRYGWRLGLVGALVSLVFVLLVVGKLDGPITSLMKWVLAL